jgi:lipoprotein-anchoring transpeptidase ErfK/SrfK
MKKTLHTYSILLSMALCMAMVLTFIASGISFAATASTWTGTVTGTANVRTAPSTSAAHVATYGAGMHVTVYATVRGQVVWGGISNWYRVSSLNTAPRYIYAGLVARANGGGGGGSNPSPASGQGKLILVNRANKVQRLYAYDHGKLVFTTLVTTGSLYLQTPLGTWHVYRKLRNVTFYSPWPKGSPYYYSPEHVNYALDYDGAMFIHDATWRSAFGPGTDRRHRDPKHGWMDGSHGCVNTSLSAAQWLYNWAGIGTTVRVID